MKIVVVKCYYQQMACSQATVVYSKLFNTFFAATAIIDATEKHPMRQAANPARGSSMCRSDI